MSALSPVQADTGPAGAYRPRVPLLSESSSFVYYQNETLQRTAREADGRVGEWTEAGIQKRPFR